MFVLRTTYARWLATVAAFGVGGGALIVADGAGAYTSPAIWVGSPVKGTWGLAGDSSTVPNNHHTLVKASPRNDWSVDLTKLPATDREVYLYVAPSDSSLNSRVTTRITQIVDNSACKNGGGGDFVTVGIYYNGTLYGRATYAHIDRVSSLTVGKTVSRWGTKLGDASNLTGSATGGSVCWTGRHVHVEMRAETQYACWNRGFTLGKAVGRTNFIGFVSGPLGAAPKACP